MTETTRAADAPRSVRTGAGTDGVAGRTALVGARQRIQSLYPVSTGRGVSFRVAGLGLLFVAAMTAISISRVGGPGALDSVWAEDGAVFYQATFHHSFFSALFTPNNGYLEFLPRFLMGLVSLLPVSRAAAAIALTGTVLSSAMALLVYHASAEHIRSRVLRATLAIVTALPVFGAGEISNNIVNLQWFLLYVTFWMLVWNPQAVGRRAVAAAVLFLAVSSDPIPTFFLTPILLARLWCRPWRESRWQVYGVAAGLVFQGLAMLHGGDDNPRKLTTDFSLGFAGNGYTKDVLGQALVSPKELAQLGLTSTWIAPTIGVVLLAIALVGAGLLFSSRGLFAALCLGTSVVLSAFLVMSAGASLPRYAEAPVLLLITAFAVLADTNDFGRVPVTALCVLLALNLFANFPVGTDQLRAQFPSWFAQVKDGKHGCEHDAARSTVRVQTAPGSGWAVKVPCSALVSGTVSGH